MGTFIIDCSKVGRISFGAGMIMYGSIVATVKKCEENENLTIYKGSDGYAGTSETFILENGTFDNLLKTIVGLDSSLFEEIDEDYYQVAGEEADEAAEWYVIISDADDNQLLSITGSPSCEAFDVISSALIKECDRLKCVKDFFEFE